MHQYRYFASCINRLYMLHNRIKEGLFWEVIAKEHFLLEISIVFLERIRSHLLDEIGQQLPQINETILVCERLLCFRDIGVVVDRRINEQDTSASVGFTCNLGNVIFQCFLQFTEQAVVL